LKGELDEKSKFIEEQIAYALRACLEMRDSPEREKFNSRWRCQRLLNFSPSEIISKHALRQVEADTPVLDVCRRLGITEQTFYHWKKKFAGMGVAELRRLRQFEDENRKLKQLVADLTLDKHILQQVLSKKF
jgi:putative transposase